MNEKNPTAIKGTPNHAKRWIEAELYAGAINSVV
jgi:hypothetical protein